MRRCTAPGASAWIHSERARVIGVAVHDDEPRFHAGDRTKADAQATARMRKRDCSQGARGRIDGRSIVPTTPADYNCAMADSVNLTHHFLIAMPGMVDPHFRAHADLRLRAQRATARSASSSTSRST